MSLTKRHFDSLINERNDIDDSDYFYNQEFEQEDIDAQVEAFEQAQEDIANSDLPSWIANQY